MDGLALYEQYDEALFRIALMELMQEEIAALEQSAAAGEADKMADARVMARMNRAFGRRRAMRAVRRNAPRVVTVAACVVLVLFAGLTTALATSETVRNQVMGLLIRVGSDSIDLSLQAVDDVERAEVPAGWMGESYPGYIPRSYGLDSVDDFDGTVVRYAHKRTGAGLSFWENDEFSTVGLMAEDATIRYVTVHGMPAILSLSSTSSFVSWSEGNKFFIVEATNDDEQMLIRIADSVRRIKQGGGD